MIHSGRKCFFLNAIFFVFGRNGALFDLYDLDGWILVEPIKATRGQTNLLDYKQSTVDLQTFLVVGPKKT